MMLHQNLSLSAAPHHSSSERSSSSNYVSSSCAVNNSIVNSNEDANITELYQPSSGMSGDISNYLHNRMCLSRPMSVSFSFCKVDSEVETQ